MLWILEICPQLTSNHPFLRSREHLPLTHPPYSLSSYGVLFPVAPCPNLDLKLATSVTASISVIIHSNPPVESPLIPIHGPYVPKCPLPFGCQLKSLKDAAAAFLISPGVSWQSVLPSGAL